MSILTGDSCERGLGLPYYLAYHYLFGLDVGISQLACSPFLESTITIEKELRGRVVGLA